MLGDETKDWDIKPLCEYKDGRREILPKSEAGWRIAITSILQLRQPVAAEQPRAPNNIISKR